MRLVIGAFGLRSKILTSYITILISLLFPLFAFARNPTKDIVSSTFQIILKEFPDAFNSSIIQVDDGFLLTFRYTPDRIKMPWISYVGAVLLDESFKQISQAELLDLRNDNIFIPSQAEDARLFEFQGDLYIIYNDNPNVMNTSAKDRRDIYIAKLAYTFDGAKAYFSVDKPLKLVHQVMYEKRLWEKNWVPIVWNNTLFLAYSINPHEILSVDLESGICLPLYTTTFTKDWKWGSLRGGTSSELFEGEYLAFFHSGKVLHSEASTDGKPLWHYVMGAYTFSPEPPFTITKISPLPLNDTSFYTKSSREKRVIYPGGYFTKGDNIYVTYGKDDEEIWMAVINKNKLYTNLQPVSYESLPK